MGLPGIARRNLGAILLFVAAMGSTLTLWFRARHTATRGVPADKTWQQVCRSDPGWLAEPTIHVQDCQYDSLVPEEKILCREEYGSERHLDSRCWDSWQATLCKPCGRSICRSGDTDAGVAGSHADALAQQDIGSQRAGSLMHGGSQDYMELLSQGRFKQVCVVCRLQRELRSHHCKECGRCVRRLDHHCPWIDNCVGLGNRRTFFCFLVVLFVTLISFYYTASVYVVAIISPGGGRVAKAILARWRTLFEPRHLLVLLVCAFDFVWLYFVAGLIVRHTTYMCVNITTYEVLVRPHHVQKRFPRNVGNFWFLRDLGFSTAVRNCTKYWTLNVEEDVQDFSSSTGFVPSAGAEERHGSPGIATR